ARGRIVGDLLDDFVRHVETGHHRADALLHRGAEGVVDVHEYHRFRRHPGRVEQFLLIGEGVAENHRRGGKISKDEFVALLGDRGRRGDVDDEGNALCSATCAIAVVWPESKAPTRSCAPSLISFSARARATSTLVSVSAFMIASSGRPSSLKIGGASSTPRWQSWPMPACAPERGSRTPTFSGPPCARAKSSGALAASNPAAPAPAAKLRRVTRAELAGDVRVICGPPSMRLSAVACRFLL